MTDKSVLKEVITENVTPIKKPAAGFSFERFKSTQAPNIAGLQTLLTQLPCHKVGDTEDFLRLHPNEEAYWSPELCFVNVPIKGVKKDTLHIIDETLAMRYLESKRILRFRLALAAKPFDVFFLCHIPSQNLDNIWNSTACQGLQVAKIKWVSITSRKAEGKEGYKIGYPEQQEAFPNTNWPTQTPLEEIVGATFDSNHQILTDDHPALARLIGRVVKLS
jgi:hypothetical protein